VRPAIIGGMLVAWTYQSDAQVVPPLEIVMPPWNSQHIFEPAPLPQLADKDSREDSREVVAPEDTPVKGRAHPDYAARGIRAGDWMFNPALYAGTLYNSNVFASPSNQQSDIVAQAGAGLGAQSLWERHGINVNFGALSTLYGHHSGLNQTDASFATTGHYDIDHSTQLFGAVRASYLHLGVGTLTSPTGAVEPTPYTHLSGDVALRKEFGRVTAAFGTRVDSYDYGSTVAQNGSIISQDARDGQIYTVYGRTDYAFSEKSAFFGSVEGNWRNLEGTPTQSLESNGYRALAGFDLEFTHLIKGEIAGGYMRQHFVDPSIGNIEGPAYRAMLTWSPSRSVDVHLNAEQIVTEASDTTAAGILANAVQLGVDYEIRPNVVLLTAATFEKDRFHGLTREDNVYALDARINYAMNNVTSLSLRYRYTRRDSNVPDASYDQHLVGVNASAHF